MRGLTRIFVPLLILGFVARSVEAQEATGRVLFFETDRQLKRG